MKSIQLLFAFMILLIACNRSPSHLSELLNKPDAHDSSSHISEKIVRKDSAITAGTKQLDSLITAARDNDISLAKSLLHRGVNANGKIFRARYFWDSPLSEAARRNHVEMVKILIEAGADPNLDLGKNRTPFHSSVGGCSLDVGPCSDSLFALLLAKGGNVNTFNKYHGLSALASAINSGDLKKATILIDRGAVIEPDSINDFQSPLGLAVSQLEFEMVSLLLKRGVNINAVYSEMHEDCITCPADITVIHSLATMYGYKDHAKVDQVLDLILRQKPDLSIQSEYGLTALDFAAFGSNLALIDKLVQHGARLATTQSSPLHCAAQFSNLSMVKHLLNYKVNVNLKDADGNTPLHLSLTCCGGGYGEGITETERAQTIELLLSHGADPSIENYRGESFIQDCKKIRYKEVSKVLVKRGLLTPAEANGQ